MQTLPYSQSCQCVPFKELQAVAAPSFSLGCVWLSLSKQLEFQCWNSWPCVLALRLAGGEGSVS